MSGIPLPPSAERQQCELWAALLDHNQKHEKRSTTDGRDAAPQREQRDWPAYDRVMYDIKHADYSDSLRCPRDLRRPISGDGGGGIKKVRSGGSGGGAGARKTLCPYGVVCCARMELFPQPSSVSSQPYTGLLTPGVTIEHCVVRLSSAMKPPRDEITSKLGRAFLCATGDKLRNARLFPTAAVKAFRGNGVRSGNLLFAGCKVGQPERDYFAHCQCTQLTERVAKPLKPFVRKFWTYSDYPLSLGVSDFCSYDASGAAAASTPEGRDAKGAHFPFCVVISPVRRSCDDESDGNLTGATCPDRKRKTEEADFDSFLNDMESIPSGIVLFDLFACPDPASVPDPTKLQRIGRVTSTSEMIPSSPDDGLFFRHQRKEEDYHLRPSWRTAVKEKCTPDGGKTVGTVAKLAGWELFEGHIAQGAYVDFEALSAAEGSVGSAPEQVKA